MRFSPVSTLACVMAMSLLTSCAGGRLYLNEPAAEQTDVDAIPDYTIYALGDAGELNSQSKSVMARLAEVTKDDTQKGMVVFLGDNIYPAGFPPEENVDGQQYAEEVMMNQIDGLSSYAGRIIFIPGNHDWNEFKPGGLAAIKRQGDYLRNLNDPRIQMLPAKGCGGPVTLELNEDIIMIIVDSQWWLQKWNDEPDMHQDCPNDTREELISALHQTIKDHKGKQIIMTMHHPLYTQGTHGGHFTVRDHLFPLSKVVKWLYLPLPVIGSIYPYYRSVFGHHQDIQHRNYTNLKESVLAQFDLEDEIIFLAGHDHNLQYIRKGNDHFLLSGGGSKQNAVANGKDLVYGHKTAGFMQLDFFSGNGVRLTVYEVDPASGAFNVVFSRFIIKKTGQS